MTHTITATELKKNLGHYLDAAQNKEETYITKNGKKIARLAPIYNDAEEYFLVKEEQAHFGNLTVSYEEFLEMSEGTEQRLEYLNCEVYAMCAPSVTHQQVVARINFEFMQYFKGKSCDVFTSPFDVTLYKKDIKYPDVLQPDILVACDMDKVNEKDRYVGVPTIVVEVLSPSTRSRDVIFKMNSYMLAGVKEYWIADPVDRMIMIYSFENNGLKHVKTFESGIVQSFIFDMSFNIDNIF